MRSFIKIAVLAIAVMPALLPQGPLSRQIQSPQKTNSAQGGQEVDLHEIGFFEQYCFDEINRRREENGLGKLILSEQLRAVARSYSRRMAEEGFFSHADPQGRTVRDRALEASLKWTVLGENLLKIKGYINPVPPTVERWMQSPGHRVNLLEPDVEFSAVGAWVSSDETYFFTQLFLGTKPLPQKSKVTHRVQK